MSYFTYPLTWGKLTHLHQLLRRWYPRILALYLSYKFLKACSSPRCSQVASGKKSMVELVWEILH
jgi:hypothetical protein